MINDEYDEYKTLSQYKNLQDTGHVLRKMKEEREYTTRDLIILYFNQLRANENDNAEPVIEVEELQKIFDFSFKKIEGGLFKSDIQIRRQEVFLRLARSLGSIYKLNNKGKSSPRVKVSSSTGEIIRGTSSIQNIYPKGYLTYIEDFLKDNPIEDWHLDKNNLEGIEFDLVDITIAKCIYCNQIMKKQSIIKHVKTVKHIKNKESK